MLDAARRAMREGGDVIIGRRPGAPAPIAIRSGDEYPVVRPRDVLPHPRDLDCMVAWDTETSGLYVDEGKRVAAVSVAYSLKSDPDTIVAYAFPFDQGRSAEKGFTPVRSTTKISKGQLKADAKVATILEYKTGDALPYGYKLNGRGEPVVDLDAWLVDVNLGEEDWEDLKRWLKLAGEYVGLTGHNDKFDLHHTHAGTRQYPGIDLEQLIAWDSQLGCAVLWPLELIGLKETATRLWGRESAEDARVVRDALMVAQLLFGLTNDNGGNKRYDLLPWSINGPYAAQDAVLTLRLTKLQTTAFEEGEARWLEIDRHMDLTRVLYRVEERGFGPLDRERTTEVAEALERRIEQLQNAMPFSPPTAYRAKEYFFDDLGLKPWKGAEEGRHVEWVENKKGGKSKKVVKQGSLSIDVALRMAKQGVPFAAEYAEMQRLTTANNMQYRGYLNLAGPDGRLRTNFKQAFVRSGRMSVERFQAQAIPRRDSVKIDEITGYGKIPHPRDLFLVPEGRTRVTMDLSQAELRVAFKFSDCKLGIEQIEAGRDIHGEMATQIFNVRKDVDESFSHYRYISKRGVFGGIFMVGPKTFQDTIWKLAGIELPWKTAQDTVYGFRRLYPEIEKAYNESQMYVEEHGFVDLVDGTRSWFSGRDYPNTAWNRRVQGSLALFNIEWLTYVESITAQWDALVLSVHDSVTLDLPHDVVEEVTTQIADWTARKFEEWFGIVGKVDTELGF